MADQQSTESRDCRELDLIAVDLGDGSDYSIRLWHWLGTPDCPAKAPRVLFCADGPEPYTCGSSLSLSAAQTRALADRLVRAAELLEKGWR